MTDDDRHRPAGERAGALRRLALVYMTTALGLFLLMGLLGLLMRLDQAGLFVLPPLQFYQVMTLHGGGMIAMALLGAMGGLANALSMAISLSPRLLWAAYVVYLAGVALFVIGTLIGGFAAGWTMLPPLPFDPSHEWPLWAAVVSCIAYLLIGVGFLLFCLNVLYAARRAFGGLGGALGWPYLFSAGKNQASPPPPPMVLAATTVSIDGVLTVAAGALLLMAMLAQAAGLVGSLDALLAKNFMFFFGHMTANLTIYLAAGLVYTTLPVYVGRAWKASWPVVLAFNVLVVGVILPYPHHLYQDFVQPLGMQIVGQVGSYAAGLPVILVTVTGGLTLIYRSGMRWSVPSILIAWGLWGWVFGGIGAFLDSTIAVNQVMHNTLWVPAHFHTYYLLGAVAFVWAYFYHLTGELSGRHDRFASKIAAWMYGLGGLGFVLTLFLSGAAGVPRRYAEHLPEWQIFAKVGTPFVIALGLGIGWLAVEMFARLGIAWRNAAAHSA